MAHSIQESIAGSKHAQELIALFDLDGKHESFIDGFYSELARLIPESAKGKSELRVMDEHEAQAFERSLMKFGKHKGERVIDVPIDYLTMYADSALKIQAYLRSDRGKRRIELE